MSTAETEVGKTTAESPFDWPFFGLQDDVRPTLGEASARGVRAVLATLYGVVGGAPRGAGAQMVFLEDDALVGFLSGGCIEADLALNAKRVMAQQRSERFVYGEGGPMDIRLPCGSRIEVLLEPIEPEDAAVARLLQLTQGRRPALWLTDGDERTCIPTDETENLSAKLRQAAATAALSEEICGYAPSPFVAFRAFAPPRRLIAIGADPIALAVVTLAAKTGFETVLIRPRGPEVCPLPGVRYYCSDVDTALSACHPDPWTAVAILTHDAGEEHAALTAALTSKAGYVGALGSRRRVPERNARLASVGITSADIARVHAPIGLPIGGKSPWEIAVSVIAEVVSELDAARRPAAARESADYAAG
jgi:xanthine dehydrogenase accessory factor